MATPAWQPPLTRQAASIPIEVFLPDDTDDSRVAAVRGYGAAVHLVPGGREAAAAAARKAVVSSEAWYASHAHQPSFHHGVKTLAFEVASATQDDPPEAVVVPAGNGTLVIGLWLGFRELARSGRLDAPPRIVAVQAELCAPLAGLAGAGPTAASGIAIARPPRLSQVRGAIHASGGSVLTVSERQIATAVDDLADRGTATGPTGAVAWAGWLEHGKGIRRCDRPVVVVSSGG